MYETHIGGIKTNISFFRELLSDEEFRAGHLHTGLIQEFLRRRKPQARDAERERVAAIVALAASNRPIPKTDCRPAASLWLLEGRSRLLQ